MSDPEEDEAADLQRLYRRYVGLLRRRALRLLRDEQLAEDLTQEAFVRWIEYHRGGGSARDASAFLFRTTTNLALNYLRDRKNRGRLLDQKVAPAQELGGKTAGQRADEIAVRKVIAESDEEGARIALLYYVDGMNQDEIAEHLGMQRRTVGRRLERFVADARSAMGG